MKFPVSRKITKNVWVCSIGRQDGISVGDTGVIVLDESTVSVVVTELDEGACVVEKDT